MKNFKIILLLFAFSLALLGCKKDQVKYSCDEDVHNWTVENIKDLSDLNRAVLATLPVIYQRAAFRAFTPEKKSEIWQEKLDLVLTQDWTDDEFELITELREKFIPDLYFPENLEHSREVLNEWADRAYEIGMDSVTVIVNFAHIATYEELEILALNPEIIDYSELEAQYGFRVPGPPGGSTYSKDCNCSWDLVCSISSMGSCDNSKCNTTETGCSYGWNSACKKVCTDDNAI